MKKIRYVGHADTRKFTKADFERHGVKEASAVTFSHHNGHVNEVSDSVAEFLLADKNFQEVDEGSPASTSSIDSAPEDEGFGGGGSAPSGTAGATVGGSTSATGSVGGSTS